MDFFHCYVRATAREVIGKVVKNSTFLAAAGYKMRDGNALDEFGKTF